MKHQKHIYLTTLLAFGQAADAATFTWLAERPTGTGNGWTAKANYQEWVDASDTAGQFTPTNADILVFDAGTRNAEINNANTVGKIVIGSNFGGSIGSTAANNVGTIDGSGGVPGSGIEILAGRGQTNINGALNLVGGTVISNSGSARLQFGNSENGRGGLHGSGSLGIVNGIVALSSGITLGHSYSGDVTVGGNGALQLYGGAVFNQYSSLTVAGTLIGRGAFGSATIANGGSVRPGNEAGGNRGPLTFSTLTLQSGSLVELGYNPDNDNHDSIVGDTVVNGGALELTLAGAAAVFNAGSYNLFTGGTLAGDGFEFVTLNNENEGLLASFVNNGTEWTASHLGVDYTFDFSSGVLTIVPEPGASALALLGVSLLILRRRNACIS